MKILHAEHMRRIKWENEWGVNENAMCLTLPISFPYMLTFVLLYLPIRSMDYSDIIELTKL